MTLLFGRDLPIWGSLFWTTFSQVSAAQVDDESSECTRALPCPLPFPVCFWWWPLDTWPESLGASLTGVPSPSRWGCGLGPSGTCVSLPKCGSPSGASPRAVFLRTKAGQAPLLPERQAISCCLTRGVAWRDSLPVRDRSCSIYNILDMSTHGDSFPN